MTITQFNQSSRDREQFQKLAKILNSARAQLQALNIRTDTITIQSVLYLAAGITNGPAQVPPEWTPFDINAPMTEPLGSSVVGLSRNPDSTAGLDSAAFELRLLGQAKAGYGSVFKGPYETTGQRAAVPDGQGLDDKELRQMCWFVKGVVEKVNPMLPASGDHDALVPTTAHPPPTEEKPESGTWVFLTLPGVPRGVTWQCDLNQIPE